MNAETVTSKPAGGGLVRAMGRFDLTAVGINQVIGSGIFVLPATVALMVGTPSSVWPWLLAGLANLLFVLCFAEAATRFRDAGGPYLYAAAAFGPFVGFEVAWMLWLTRLASQAALANALALYAAYFLPAAATGVGRALVIVVTLAALAAVNYCGVRYGSWAVNLFTVSKLVPLAAFVFLGFFFVDWSRFAGIGSPFGPGTGEAVLLLMFAFGGYELITLPAGEARSPRRDVPRALVTTIGSVCLIYILVQMVVVGTLAELSSSSTPLADAARGFLGAGAGVLVAIGGLVSIAGSNAGGMLAGPRITFALGDRGQLPKVFAHVHPRFRTPDVSILLYAGIAVLLALSGSFEQMAMVSAVARLVFYAATCAAIPRLRRLSPAQENTFRLLGGPTIPMLALAVSIAVAFWPSVSAYLGGTEFDPIPLLAGGVALLVGAVLYRLSGRARLTSSASVDPL